MLQDRMEDLKIMRELLGLRQTPDMKENDDENNSPDKQSSN